MIMKYDNISWLKHLPWNHKTGDIIMCSDKNIYFLQMEQTA